MKILKTTALMAIALIALLAGCSRQLDRGEIVSKYYEPAYEYVQFIPIAISCGNNCTTTMQIPYIVYVDESYIFRVKGVNKKGEEIEENWYVEKTVYENVQIGNKCDSKSLQAKREPNSRKVEKKDS